LQQLVTSYRTIDKPSSGIFKDKGSKFLSFAYPVKDEQTIKAILDKTKKDFYNARHHCYAYRLTPYMTLYRSNDDGEPSGTAGKPILGQIQSNNLTNVLIVVVRYFGGTLLGTGGLIQAYKLSSADAIQNAKIIDCPVVSTYKLGFAYPQMNEVMKIIKEFDLETQNTVLDLKCSYVLKMKKEVEDNALAKLKNIKPIDISYIGEE